MTQQKQSGPVVQAPGMIRHEDSDSRFVVVETEPTPGTKAEKKPFLIMTPAGERLARAVTLEAAVKRGEEAFA